MKRIILICFLILLISLVSAEEFYPTTISEMTTEVQLHGFGTISGLKTGEEINFQTITFPDSSFQKIKVLNEALYIDGKTIFPTYSIDEFDNKYVNFKIPYNGDFNYELVAQVNTQALIHELTDYNIEKMNGDLEPFLSRSEKVESDSTQILTLATNKLYSNSFFETLNDTIFWVNEYVEYATGQEFNQYYLLQKSAVDTLIEKKGVCDEFANLATAMLRARGIPTRLAIGITFDGREWGNHAWIEVYHTEHGWIPSDPTFREPGFVDATHIKLGSFSDVSQSVAKASYPSTANISFQTQTLPEVTVIDKEYFEHVALTTNKTELLTNQWNEFPITITNLTNATITIPIKLRDTYKDLIFDDDVKSVILDTGEEETVIFNVYPKLTLEDNEVAKGTLTFDSLTKPSSFEFTIKPSPALDNGVVNVLDVTPIAFEDKLIFEIKITNQKVENQIININIQTPDGNLNWDENIGGFVNETIHKEINNYSLGKYALTITTPTQEYIQNIYPVKSKTNIVVEKPKETNVVQQVTTGSENQKSGKENIELIMFIGLAVLTVITIALIFIFATRHRYV